MLTRRLVRLPAALIKRRNASTSTKKEKILMTGCLGQIGSELIGELKLRGHDVVATDVRPPPEDFRKKYPDVKFRYLDVVDEKDLRSIVVEERATMILHLSAKLSKVAEMNPGGAFGVNVRSVENVFEVARHYGLRVYSPSSIAAFGPTTPNLSQIVDDVTIQRPLNVYGVAKVYMETLGEWYNYRYGLDFRSLRYPGILSADTEPGGGTTDYAVDIFYKVLEAATPGADPNERSYICGVGPNRRLPMMFMPDCLKATCDLIDADNSKLTQRTYNVAAVSFTPEEITASLNEHIATLGNKTRAKHLKMVYQPDIRDSIAKTWPAALNDSAARKDWNWKPDFELKELTSEMLARIEKKLTH